MTKQALAVFEKSRTVLIETTKKAFVDYCARNGMKNHGYNVKIKDLWLTNYEMVKHPTCVFTGEVIVTKEKLMSLISDLVEYDRRTFEIESHITIDGKYLYEVKACFCFDYVTEEIRFTPNW